MNKILEAINFAINAHSGQKRKGKEVPYITHPLSVGLLLAKSGADEDVVIAGILHDTIEDTKVTYGEILEKFGERIADMVNDVTEQDKSLPWAVRKQKALEHIPHMGKDSIMVKSADALHNLRDQIADCEVEGEEMWKKFNAKKAEQLQRYEKLILALKKAWNDNPLMTDLEIALNKLLDLAK